MSTSQRLRNLMLRAGHRRARRGWLALAAALALGVLAARPAAAAPDYALSGRAAELSKIVLAQTPLGPITALDVLMFDDMTSRALTTIPIDRWLEPRSLASEADTPAMRRAIEGLVALGMAARRAGDWQPAADRLRVMSFGAAEAAWIQQVVQPQVKVLDPDVDSYYLAHSERYLHQQQIQVRYIFSAVASTSDTQAVGVAVGRLEALAQQIRGGATSFEDAARRTSEAESARQGGLLPPFTRGTFFAAFETQAYALDQPGQMSPVFVGPGGVYLVQLVQKWPVRNIPIEEVAPGIRQFLQFDHVRHYYPYLLTQMQQGRFLRNAAYAWDYLNFEAPIAQLGEVRLMRDDLMRFYGSPTGENFTLRADVVARGAGEWLEGQTVMEDLEKRGMGQHIWILRARELATIWLRAQHVFAAEVPIAAYQTIDEARATLAANPAFAGRLRSVRVLSLSAAPKIVPTAPPSQIRLAQSHAVTIDAYLGEGTLPSAAGNVRLSERLGSLPPGDDTAIREAVRSLAAAAAQPPWTDVTMRVADAGWQPMRPGTAWWDLLAGAGPGQMSQPQTIGDLHLRYWVVEQKPLDLKPYESQPLVYKSLAFDAASMALVLREVDGLRRAGSIRYEF